MPGPVEIFISYATQDEYLRIELEQHLSALKRTGLIRAWHLGKVEPGQSFRTAIESHISSAQLILLLVSASFIDSDDCYDNEMAKALERWQRGEALVVPILVQPCFWEQTHLRRLQPLPDNRHPVTSKEWHSRAEAWVNVVRGIQGLVERLAQRAAVAKPGAAIFTAPPPVTISDAPGQPAPRASTPSYPSSPSPHASAPSYPDPHPSHPSRASAPSNLDPRPSRASAPSSPGPYPPHAPALSHPAAVPALGRPSNPAASRPSSSAWASSMATPPTHDAASWPPRVSTPEVQPALSTRRPSLPRTSDAAPRRSSRLAIWLVTLIGLAGTGIAIHIARWLLHGKEALGPLSANPAPSPSSYPQQETKECGPPCCGGSLCAVTQQNTGRQVCFDGQRQCRACASGRACIPGPCEAMIAPSRSFLLRLANVWIPGKSAPMTAQVCVRRHASPEPWTCTPYEQAADLLGASPTNGMSTRLQVTTADLLEGRGIDVWVSQPGAEAPIALFNSTAHHAGINVTALCNGLRFPPSNSSEPNPNHVVVLFYLDDP